MSSTARRMWWLGAACALLTACASQPRSAVRDLPATARADPDRLLVIAVSNVPPAPQGHAGATFRGYGDDASYAVSDTARRTLHLLSRQYSLRKVAEWPIDLLQMQCAVYEMPPGASREALLASLNADARIRLAQPLQTFATQTRGSNAVPDTVPAAVDSMSLHAAHRLAQGNGVRVAVIDTGVDAGHPDLAGRVAAEYNFVDAARGAFRLDRHGTAVAGVIAANPGSANGVLGIAPRARLVALKACWQLEAGRDDARCNSYTLAQALAKAIELRTEVINLSLTGPTDPLLSALVERATRLGIIVVGPGSSDSAAGGFPGTERAVLSVIRTGAGPAPEQVLRAPGNEILTLAPGARYSISSGDSIATAAVSGVTALLLSRRHQLRSDQVQKLLSDSSVTLTADGIERRQVNACRALAALEVLACPMDIAAAR